MSEKLTIFNQSVNEWNEGHGLDDAVNVFSSICPIRADLDYHDFSNQELDTIDFSGNVIGCSSFQNAKLSYARFCETRLGGTSFQEAKLIGADFSFARCNGDEMLSLLDVICPNIVLVLVMRY